MISAKSNEAETTIYIYIGVTASQRYYVCICNCKI